MAGMDIGSFTGSDFKGDDAIKKIMEAEAKGKVPVENSKFRLNMQKQAWEGLQNKLGDLNTATKDFFSPAYSAFRKIKTNSSSPDILNINTEGLDLSTIQPANYSMIPKQLANKDHFKSDSLNTQDTLPASTFNILYHNTNYSVNFTGGSLSNLADAINTVASDFLKATVMSTQAGEYLDIQAKEIGKKNKIDFSGNVDILKQIGLIRNAVPTYYNIELNKPIGLSGTKDIPDLLMNDNLTLKPKDTATKIIPTMQTIDSETQLWIYLKHDIKPEQKPKEEPPKIEPKISDPIIGFQDKIWVGDVNLLGEALITQLINKEEKPQKAPEKPLPNIQTSPQNPNAQVTLLLNYKDGQTLATKTYFNMDTQSIQVIKSAVPNGQLVSVTIKNDSLFDLDFSKGELIVFNRNQFDKKNPLTKAQNAIIHYQDIDYERETNTIKDIVPGTLTLQGETDKPVSLSIDFDYDAILEQLKNWVIAYNNTMDFIRNTTQEDPALAGSLNRDRNKELTDKRLAYEKLSVEDKEKLKMDGSLFAGVLIGDSSIKMVKDKLQAFIHKPYKTDAKEKVMFLKQLGVDLPNASQLATMSDRDRENYRAGYLDFTAENQKQFLALLKEYFLPVQQFFFQRTNGSKLYNEGMFIDYNNTVNLFLQRYINKLPGFFLVKAQILDNQIKEQDKKMTQLDDKMRRDEDKLRQDFSKVYEAQNRAKSINNQFSKLGRSE